MYGVGVFSVGEKCFASILPILRCVDLLYFEIYVDFACYIIKMRDTYYYLSNSAEYHYLSLDLSSIW